MRSRSFDAAALDGVAAKRVVEVSAEIERLASGLRTLAAGRVATTGAWVGDGEHRDAGAWMASVTRTTVGRARATIETAERLRALPATTDALLAGSLSEAQVDVVASAATANPRAEGLLLRTASTQGVKGLKTEAARRRSRGVDGSGRAVPGERSAAGTCGTGASPMSRG